MKLLVLLSLLTIDPAVAKLESDRIEVVRKIGPATAAIFSADGGGGGSGVVVSPDGYCLTNFHVSGTGPALRVGLPDGKVYPAVVVGIDPVGDLAVIQLLGRSDFPHAPMGDSDQLSVGETVLAVGNPFLLAVDFTPTVTMGIVSGLHRYQPPSDTLLEYTDCIQTDAAINPGNSGGPLFNLKGEVVGINGRGSFEKRGRINVGVGYAISINQVKNFFDALKGGLIVDHATLGAVVVADDSGRVVVDQIINSSDAFRLGLRNDDCIVSLAGRPIGSVNQFKNILGVFPQGWRTTLVYRRGDSLHTIHPRLAGVHRPGELAEKISSSSPPGPPGLPIVEPPMPEKVRQVFEKRPGFANYHFNRLRRDELLSWIKPVPAGRWRFRGSWSGVPATVTVTDQIAAFESAGKQFAFLPDEVDFTDPPNANGLLATVFAWRRFLIRPPKSDAAVVYLGAIPDGAGRLQPVLSTETKHWIGRWSFDRLQKRLTGAEGQLPSEGGCCEIQFTDLRPSTLGEFPHRWRVLADQVLVGEFVVDRLEVLP